MKKYLISISIFLCFVLSVNSKNIFCADDFLQAEDLEMFVGEVKLIPTKSPKRVAVGNPAVADVHSVNDNQIIIVANSSGTTTLVWADKFGETTLNLKVLTENMDIIKERVDVLLKNINIPGITTRANNDEAKVLILGKVKTQDEIDRIKTVLGALNSKIVNLIQIDEEKRMIEIEAEVLEIDRDSTRELGLQWPTEFSFAEVGSKLLTQPMFRMTEWSRSTMAGKILLLEKNGKARVLSRPKLACQSGKEAELLVGGEKPVMTSQVAAVSTTGASSSTEVDYKEYGIKLKISPVITPEKNIQLNLNVDISDIGEAEILGLASAPTARAYPVKKRTTSTQLLISDGQTLAISGLIRQKQEEDVQKLPFMGEVPIFGALFRSKTLTKGGGNGERGDTELIVLLTAKILPLDGMISKNSINPNLKSDYSNFDNKQAMIKEAEEKLARDLPLSELVSSYSASIGQYLQEKVIYPSAAQMAGIKGQVRLALNLSKDGQLLESRLERSSGFSVLDESALRTAKQCAPYPEFPAGISEQEMWIQVPIIYNISE